MSAARSPRVICGALSMRAVLRRAAAPARPARARASSLRLDGSRSARCASASAYAFAAPVEIAARPRAARQSAPATLASRRIELDRLAEVLERRVGVALLPLDAGQLAIQERAVGRAGDRRRVGLRSPRRDGRPRRLARARQRPARRRGTSALRRAAPDRQRRIGGQRGLERRQRVGLPVRARAAPARVRPAPTHRSACRSSARSKCGSAAFGSFRASST